MQQVATQGLSGFQLKHIRKFAYGHTSLDRLTQMDRQFKTIVTTLTLAN